MNNLEFLNFTKTPNEKHLGVATIRVEKRWILRFKIAENPRGEGFFSNAPAIKVEDSYYPAFECDSSYESGEIKKFVLSNVKQCLNQSVKEVAQVFNQPIQEQFNFIEPPPF